MVLLPAYKEHEKGIKATGWTTLFQKQKDTRQLHKTMTYCYFSSYKIPCRAYSAIYYGTCTDIFNVTATGTRIFNTLYWMKSSNLGRMVLPAGVGLSRAPRISCRRKGCSSSIPPLSLSPQTSHDVSIRSLYNSILIFTVGECTSPISTTL